jgi:diguanylate cyclase (GGDEF)-like protein/PAS domain S-box-containing protein
LPAFVDAVPALFFVLDARTEMVLENPLAAEVIDGGSPPLAIFSTIQDRVRAAAGPVRLYVTFKDREWSIIATPFQGDDGEPYVGVVGFDVTEVRKSQRKVSENHERLRTALEAGFDAFVALEAVHDERGQIVDFSVAELNGNAERLLGRSRWDSVGRPIGNVLSKDWGQDIVAKYARVVHTRLPFEEEFAIVQKEGALWLRQQVVPLGDGVAVTARDVSDQKRAEQTMREHTRVLENALDGIATADAEGRIDFVNTTFASMLGRAAHELMGQPWETIVRQEDRHRLTALLTQTMRDERVEKEIRGDRPDKMPLFLNLVLMPRFLEGEIAGHYVFAMDVTPQRAYEAQLEQQMRLLNEAHAELAARSRDLEAANIRLRDLATTDGLTGLRNHRHFRERLAEEIARTERYGPPLGVLMIDVDFFKQYNDAYGHPAGDEVLRDLAAILREGVRKTDLVARYGGEEFAVVLPQTTREAAQALAERLRQAVEEHAWERQPITISVGGAEFSERFGTAEDLVEAADSALYDAKRAGRNRVAFASAE